MKNIIYNKHKIYVVFIVFGVYFIIYDQVVTFKSLMNIIVDATINNPLHSFLYLM